METSIDQEYLKILQTQKVTSSQMKLVFEWLTLRDVAIDEISKYPVRQTDLTVEYNKHINEKIKQILNL